MARQPLTPEEIKEAQEHRDVLLSLRSILLTDQGRTVFRYLLKSFDIVEVAPMYLEGKDLHDYLGFRRAGTSIFKLLSEADVGIAAGLLALIEMERQDEIHLQKFTDE